MTQAGYDVTYAPISHEQLADGIRAMHVEMAKVVETAESPDGLIAASVDARGALVDLRIDPRVYRDADSAALTRDLLDTCRAAHDAAYQRAFDITAAALDRVLPG